CESQRFGRVMWDSKGRNFNITDGKSMARLDEFNALQSFGLPLRKFAHDFAVRRSRYINCQIAPLTAGQSNEASDMIAVFVGNDDAIDVPCGLFNQRKAAKSFFFAEPGIYQKARLRGFQQRTVARTSRRENAHADADAV